jgi:hypothetical protein
MAVEISSGRRCGSLRRISFGLSGPLDMFCRTLRPVIQTVLIMEKNSELNLKYQMPNLV